MEITHIEIRPVENGGRMQAAVSVVLDGVFAIHDIKIIRGPDRLFLAMPARRLPDGRLRDIAHPICREMREKLEYSILQVYHNPASDTRETRRTAADRAE